MFFISLYVFYTKDPVDPLSHFAFFHLRMFPGNHSVSVSRYVLKIFNVSNCIILHFVVESIISFCGHLGFIITCNDKQWCNE